MLITLISLKYINAENRNITSTSYQLTNFYVHNLEILNMSVVMFNNSYK